jgi:hypothetical protein
MKIEYRQENLPELMSWARTRFKDEMDGLRKLGFSEFCCSTELLPNYSALSHFLILLLTKLNREIVRVEAPLRIAMSQPLLAHRTQMTYALIFGMGVKFYTLFTDETGLITANFQSEPVQDMFAKIYKTAVPRSIEECWQAHMTEVKSFRQAGKEVDERIRFENYLSISQREGRHLSGS